MRILDSDLISLSFSACLLCSMKSQYLEPLPSSCSLHRLIQNHNPSLFFLVFWFPLSLLPSTDPSCILTFPCTEAPELVQLLLLAVCRLGCFHLSPVCLADSEEGRKEKDLPLQLQCFVPQWHLAAAGTDGIWHSPACQRVTAHGILREISCQNAEHMESVSKASARP